MHSICQCCLPSLSFYCHLINVDLSCLRRTNTWAFIPSSGVYNMKVLCNKILMHLLGLPMLLYSRQYTHFSELFLLHFPSSLYRQVIIHILLRKKSGLTALAGTDLCFIMGPSSKKWFNRCYLLLKGFDFCVFFFLFVFFKLRRTILACGNAKLGDLIPVTFSLL